MAKSPSILKFKGLASSAKVQQIFIGKRLTAFPASSSVGTDSGAARMVPLGAASPGN